MVRSVEKVVEGGRRQRWIGIAAGLVCLVGAVRVFFFCSVFPLFNNIDEPAHFDVVYKYSQDGTPGKEDKYFSAESMEIVLMYGTPEYLSTPGQLEKGVVSRPLWTYSDARESDYFKGLLGASQNRRNPEVWSFPFYYAVAGGWYRLGQLVGVPDGKIGYWVRFLNVPVFACLVWVSYLVGVKVFGKDSPMAVGVGMLVAFFPQDVFYSINSDTF